MFDEPGLMEAFLPLRCQTICISHAIYRRGDALRYIVCVLCIFHDVLLAEDGIKACSLIPLPAVSLSCPVDGHMMWNE